MAALDARTYQTILRVKQARAFDVGGLLMRFYVYMINIGVVTMLTLAGYSFLVAGLVASAIALSTFLISPRLAKLIDRKGQRTVIPWATCIPVAGTVAMLVCVVAHAKPWILLPLAILMGALVSPQALVRARWTYLIRTRRLGSASPTLHGVFSYECLLDDLGFLVAPPLAIFLASTFVPIAGLAVGIVAYVVGAVLITTSRTTEPVVGWTPEGEEERALKSTDGREGESGREGEGGHEGEGESSNKRERSIFRLSPVVRILFAMMFFVGAFFGVLDVATVSFAEGTGDANVASGALMLQAILSMAAGFLFGMLRLQVNLVTQLVILAVCLSLSFATTAFIDSVPLLYLLTSLPAVFYAPLLIMVNATCERAVPGARFTEAIAWVNAGCTCGLALGPTLGGVVIDSFGVIATFQVGGAVVLMVGAIALVFSRMLQHRIR